MAADVEAIALVRSVRLIPPTYRRGPPQRGHPDARACQHIAGGQSGRTSPDDQRIDRRFLAAPLLPDPDDLGAATDCISTFAPYPTLCRIGLPDQPRQIRIR